MGPLCKRHHHDIHDRGWIITLDHDRNLTITLPDGTTWAHQKYRPPGKEPPEREPPERQRSGPEPPGREPPGPPPLPPTAPSDNGSLDNGRPADETRGADPHAPDDRPDATAA